MGRGLRTVNIKVAFLFLKRLWAFAWTGIGKTWGVGHDTIRGVGCGRKYEGLKLSCCSSDRTLLTKHASQDSTFLRRLDSLIKYPFAHVPSSFAVPLQYTPSSLSTTNIIQPHSKAHPQYFAHLLFPPKTPTNSLATIRLVCSLGCNGSYHS